MLGISPRLFANINKPPAPILVILKALPQRRVALSSTIAAQSKFFSANPRSPSGC